MWPFNKNTTKDNSEPVEQNENLEIKLIVDSEQQILNVEYSNVEDLQLFAGIIFVLNNGGYQNSFLRGMQNHFDSKDLQTIFNHLTNIQHNTLSLQNTVNYETSQLHPLRALRHD